MNALLDLTAAGRLRRAGLELLRLRLDDEWPHLGQLWTLLDDAERQRALRFAHKTDSARFIVGRARLREVLAAHLGISPRGVHFAGGAFGKPQLDATGPASLHFNVSHSGDWVLIAVDERAPVGVDVEAIRPQMARIDDFRGVLAPEEQTWLDALPRADRAGAFARTWVRKEAYVKAIGAGMSRDLKAIAIVDGRDGEPRLQYDRNPSPAAARWQLIDLVVDAKHVGCLAHHDEA